MSVTKIQTLLCSSNFLTLSPMAYQSLWLVLVGLRGPPKIFRKELFLTQCCYILCICRGHIQKITRLTIGAHGYNLLLNELSIAILWYNMLSNIWYIVSSSAISCYIVLFNAFLFFSSFLMLLCVISCWLM